MYEEVAVAVAVDAGQAFVLQAQDVVALGARFDLHLGLSAHKRHLNARAQGRIDHGDEGLVVQLSLIHI